MQKLYLWKGDRVLGSVSTRVSDIPNISYFPKVVSIKSFGNSWNSSHNVSFITYQAPLYLRRILYYTKMLPCLIFLAIVWKYFFCPLFLTMIPISRVALFFVQKRNFYWKKAPPTWRLSNVTFWPKSNIRNKVYRKSIK